MMFSLGHWSSRAVLSGLLAGSCLIGSAVDAGEGAVRSARTRKAAAPRVLPADYSEEQQMEIMDPESYSSGELLPDCMDDPTAGHCPPERDRRLSGRVIPTGDSIGTPLHHLNFSGDCYGENWRTQNWWCYASHSGRFHQRTHSHSLGKERCWNQLFGKLPRSYIHDTSGHPMKSFFVSQPSDPEFEYVPDSDTLTPPRMVIDYSHFEFRPSRRHGPACDPR